MSTPFQRLVHAAGVVATTLVLVCANAGLAVAEPDESPSSPEGGQTSEPAPSGDSETTSATTPDVKSPSTQSDPLPERPRAVFGNGRTPGQSRPVMKVEAQRTVRGAQPPVETGPPPSDSGEPAPVSPAAPAEAASLPARGRQAAPVPRPLDPTPAPQRPWDSSAEVHLPFVAPFTVPLPTFVGTTATRYSIDLTDPFAAYASLRDTYDSFSSVMGQAVATARAPYDPSPPPPPEPALRTMEEQPVADASGGLVGGGGIAPVASRGGGSDVMPNAPVVQAPMAVMPLPRIGPPRPVTRAVPAGAAPQVIATGSAGVRTSEVRGSVVQTGTVRASEAPPANTTAAMGNTAFRQGYPQALRTARVGEVAVVAVPGLAGLLMLVAGGGVIGYRQANTMRYLRADAARFLH